eukprot:1139228-Pelagomonas_calceolata.AAC.3
MQSSAQENGTTGPQGPADVMRSRPCAPAATDALFLPGVMHGPFSQLSLHWSYHCTPKAMTGRAGFADSLVTMNIACSAFPLLAS